jgi:hypothetical protein
MNCLKCRRRVPEGSLFCPSCGTASPQANAGAAPKRRGPTWVSTLALFLCAIGIGGGGAYGYAMLRPYHGNIAQAAVHHGPHHRPAVKHH